MRHLRTATGEASITDWLRCAGRTTMVNFPHQAYAVLTWTGVGLALFIYTRPKTKEELDAKVRERTQGKSPAIILPNSVREKNLVNLVNGPYSVFGSLS